MLKFIIHSDGGARGNPGPSAIGVVLSSPEGKVVETISEYIGETTNNQAEYKAVIAGLAKAKALEADEVECILDSELVVKQLNREYKVKHPELKPLFEQARTLALGFSKVLFRHVRREENKAADKLVNEALDKETGDAL